MVTRLILKVHVCKSRSNTSHKNTAQKLYKYLFHFNKTFWSFKFLWFKAFKCGYSLLNIGKYKNSFSVVMAAFIGYNQPGLTPSEVDQVGIPFIVEALILEMLYCVSKRWKTYFQSENNVSRSEYLDFL